MYNAMKMRRKLNLSRLWKYNEELGHFFFGCRKKERMRTREKSRKQCASNNNGCSTQFDDIDDDDDDNESTKRAHVTMQLKRTDIQIHNHNVNETMQMY